MTTNAPELIAMAVVLIAEAVFGWRYNRWVANHQAANEGVYTAFYVAGGTLATVLLIGPVIGLRATLLVLAAFGASGLPMILGSMMRHTQRIKSNREESTAAALELLHGPSSEE